LYGNNITNPQSQPSITIALSGPTKVNGTAKYYANGLYNATYTANYAGTYTMVVQVQQQSIVGSPFNPPIYPSNYVSAAETVAYGNSLNNATAGAIGSFYVQTRDLFGNNITTQTPIYFDLQFIPVKSNRTFTFHAEYLNKGIYLVTYNMTLSGTFQLNVLINGSSIHQSPFTVLVNTGPTWGPNCYATGDGLSGAITGQTQEFTLFAEDAFKNIIHHGNDPFEVNIYDSKNNKKGEHTLLDNKDGTYLVSYKLSSSGNYIVQVTLNTWGINGSPFPIKCKWAGLATSALIGIAAGGLAFVAIVGAALYIYRTKCRHRRLYTPLRAALS